MLDKLYKKLHVIFVCGNMLIISIIIGIMLKNNVKTEKAHELSYVQRIATLIVYQLENNSIHFQDAIKDYEQSDTFFCSVKTKTGDTFYQSESSFPTSAEFLLNTLHQQEQSALSVWENETKSVPEQGGIFFLKGEKRDVYWGIPVIVMSNDNMEYRLVLLYKSKTTAELLRKYAPLYLFVYFASLVSIVFLNRVILKLAFKPSIQAMNSQKEFIASASHELKSPLAVFFAHVEKLEKSGIDNYELKKSVEIMDRECMRMSQLVGDMLLLASSDANLKKITQKEVNVDTLLISLYEKYETICAKHNISFHLELNSTSYPLLYSDPELILQILCIFIDNAISHANSPAIEIQTSFTAKNITFYIVDHGVGISEQDKPYIFNSFYCADKSHTDKSHFGLGLSIANELAVILHGDMGFHDTSGGGATFYITIPIKSLNHRHDTKPDQKTGGITRRKLTKKGSEIPSGPALQKLPHNVHSKQKQT